MIKKEGTFGVKEYVYAFEKSLNYMFWVILSIATAFVISYIAKEQGTEESLPKEPVSKEWVREGWVHEEWPSEGWVHEGWIHEEWTHEEVKSEESVSGETTSKKWYIDIWKLLKGIANDDSNTHFSRLLLIVAGVLTTLPYYFYYTLKDNSAWNAYGGKRDVWGLKKIYLLYEISIMGLFYLLLMRGGEYKVDKPIVAFVSAFFAAIYIGLSLYRQKRESSIGYFFILIVMTFIFFVALGIKNLPEQGIKVSDIDKITVYMLLLLLNSMVNIFFLHKFDSCKESGIIANRIKFIMPMLSISIYTSILTYCYYYTGILDTNKVNNIGGVGENIICMLIVAGWITAYEIIISCITPYDNSLKIPCCVLLFILFILGMTFLIRSFSLEKNQNELIRNWFLLIGVCIYFVSVKYFSAITKLQRQHLTTTKSKAKIANAIMWFRNSLLASVLLILVIFIMEKTQILLLITMIVVSLLLEIFVYRYIFHFAKEDAPQKVYVIGKIIEFLAIVLPLIAFLIEITESIDLSEYLPQEPVVFVVVEAASLIVVVASLLFFIIRYDNDKWIRISQPSRRAVLHEVWNRLREIKKLTISVLPDRNVKKFEMAVITWGAFVFLPVMAITIFPTLLSANEVGFLYRLAGLFLMAFIIEGEWILVSRNLFNYYLDKMEEGKMVMKYREDITKEWEKCMEDLSDFRQSDAVQLTSGNYYRAILFVLGATYWSSNYRDDDICHAAIKTSCSIELLHKSSILVDDYLDRDVTRNGQITFHEEYPNQDEMFLLKSAMQAKALMNFAKCSKYFLCDNDTTIKNMRSLSNIIYENSLGYYRELELTSYEHIDKKEIDEINFMETINLFKSSISLGYSCFHKGQSNVEHLYLKNLGEIFGKIYQYINDLEPFTQNGKRKKQGGVIDCFGRKNTVLLTLRCHLSEEEKEYYDLTNVRIIKKLYKEYGIEQEILNEIANKIKELDEILQFLSAGNKLWVEEFRAIYNYLLSARGWGDKLAEL